MIEICRSLSLKKSDHFNDVFGEILHHFYMELIEILLKIDLLQVFNILFRPR